MDLSLKNIYFKFVSFGKNKYLEAVDQIIDLKRIDQI